VSARKAKKAADAAAVKEKKASDKAQNVASKAATKAASRKVKAADRDLQVATRECKSAKRAVGRTAREFVMANFPAVASSSTHEELGDVTCYARVNYVSCLGGWGRLKHAFDATSLPLSIHLEVGEKSSFLRFVKTRGPQIITNNSFLFCL
jgi:hypothetical protein